jgi:hypothetical protein
MIGAILLLTSDNAAFVALDLVRFAADCQIYGSAREETVI